jgi:hypothetical protein
MRKATKDLLLGPHPGAEIVRRDEANARCLAGGNRRSALWKKVGDTRYPLRSEGTFMPKRLSQR